MRYAGGDDDHVAFGEVVRFAALDIGSKKLIGPADFAADHGSTGDEGRLAVGDVEDVGLFLVYLDLTGSRAFINGNRVVGRGSDRSALRDLVMIGVGDDR